MDFCCKAKTYRSHTCSASLQHRRWKKHRRLFLQVKPAIQGRIGIFNVLHQRPPFSCLLSWHSSHSCHFHQIHFLLSAFLTDFPVESFCPDITLSNETKVTFSFSLSHRPGNHLRPSWLLFTSGSSPRPRWCECPLDVRRCDAIDSSFRRKWQKKTLLWRQWSPSEMVSQTCEKMLHVCIFSLFLSVSMFTCSQITNRNLFSSSPLGDDMQQFGMLISPSFLVGVFCHIMVKWSAKASFHECFCSVVMRKCDGCGACTHCLV